MVAKEVTDRQPYLPMTCLTKKLMELLKIQGFPNGIQVAKVNWKNLSRQKKWAVANERKRDVILVAVIMLHLIILLVSVVDRDLIQGLEVNAILIQLTAADHVGHRIHVLAAVDVIRVVQGHGVVEGHTVGHLLALVALVLVTDIVAVLVDHHVIQDVHHICPALVAGIVLDLDQFRLFLLNRGGVLGSDRHLKDRGSQSIKHLLKVVKS